MAERPADEPEGWTVRHRPALVAAAAVPLLLAALLAGAGWFYDRDLRPSSRQPVTPFPAPGLEAFVHDGARDPHRPLERMTPDPEIEAAKRAVERDGIDGWDRP